MHNNFKIDNDFKGRITDAVQIILFREFKDSNKTTIDDMVGRLNFACPYCGDSSKDPKKKRGNLFWDSLRYQCYNGGCKKHTTLNNLLKDFNLRDELSLDERLGIISYIKKHTPKFDQITTLKYNLFEKLYDASVDLDRFYQSTNSLPLEKDKYGYDFIKNRLLINSMSDFSISKNRLYILNLTPDRKRVISYQIRFLNQSTYSDKKYVTYNISKTRERCNLKNICEYLDIDVNEQNKLNKLSNIFNILSVDFTKNVTVFEGPLDSKFMKNSIALSSIDKNIDMFDDIPNIRYFFDNDSVGKNKLIELLKEGKIVFLWKKFLDDFNLIREADKFKEIEKIKDLNDVMKLCFLSKNKAYLHLEEYFSNDKLDMYFI